LPVGSSGKISLLKKMESCIPGGIDIGLSVMNLTGCTGRKHDMSLAKIFAVLAILITILAY